MALLISLGTLALVFLLICILGLSSLGKKSQKMVDLKVESKVVENQLNNLGQAKREIEQYRYFKDVAKTVIPNDKDQAQAVLDIVRIASEVGIKIESIKFPTSTLGEAARPAAPVDQSAGAATQAPTTPAPGAAATSPAPISQAKPVAGINGLYSLELIVTPETGTHLPPEQQVTYPKMLDFLQRIERNRRTAQISQVNIQPATPGVINSDSIRFMLTINIFIKP